MNRKLILLDNIRKIISFIFHVSALTCAIFGLTDSPSVFAVSIITVFLFVLKVIIEVTLSTLDKKDTIELINKMYDEKKNSSLNKENQRED